jgi:heme/copper-type cytochrome/quinol oxidase subunit 1
VHTKVRWFIKTGIGFLGAGLLLGLYLLAQRELAGGWPNPYLRSAHAHAIGFGFVVFLILGVALWLFPRAPKGDTRYRPAWISAAYWILTAGTAARIAGEVLRVGSAADWLRWAVLLSGTAQVVGLGVYFWTMWPRIRSVGSHLREAAGERF